MQKKGKMFFHLFVCFTVTILLSNNRKKNLYDRIRIMLRNLQSYHEKVLVKVK